MITSNDFNPEDWQTPSIEHKYKQEEKRSSYNNSLADMKENVESILQRIEESRVDITFDYQHWVNTGFAFVDQFGESGREYYHRVSQFYSQYSRAETDKQYNCCLRSKGSGITIRTFFKYAQDAGINIQVSSGKSPISPLPPKTPDIAGGGEERAKGGIGETGDSGDSGEIEQVTLPTFSDSILPQLPTLLQNVAKYGGSSQETDALLLGALGIISGCLPTIYGVYDGHTVYPNLFFFISARAASGKGNLKFCRYLAMPIHEREREKCEQLEKQYANDMLVWEATPKSNRGDKPEKPLQTMLFIAANTSATSFYQLLHENGERGIIFEPEADGLTKAFESDFGDYSYGLREAFHHEWISYHRRSGDEHVEINHPRLSVVLTGTPQQIASLMRNAENGLFSRFGFYRINSPLIWRDVLGGNQEEGVETIFKGFGKDFCEFYDTLCAHPEKRFRVTEAQRERFNAYFSSLQKEYYSIFKDDIIGSVRRLGLICFRIAMVLSVLRMWDLGEWPDEIICYEEDFNSALSICKTLAVHLAKVFEELTTNDSSRLTMVAKNLKRQKYFAELPDDFDRKDYVEIATRVGVPESTAEKWIKSFCAKDGPLEKVEHGRYRKKR